MGFLYGLSWLVTGLLRRIARHELVLCRTRQVIYNSAMPAVAVLALGLQTRCCPNQSTVHAS